MPYLAYVKPIWMPYLLKQFYKIQTYLDAVLSSSSSRNPNAFGCLIIEQLFKKFKPIWMSYLRGLVQEI
jgi:hypothetical protein